MMSTHRLQKGIGYSPRLETKKRYSYIIAGVSFAIVVLFLTAYIIIVRTPLVTLSTSLCLLLIALSLRLMKSRKWGLARVILCIAFLFQETLLIFLFFPYEANLNYFLFIVAPITFFIYDFADTRERTAVIIFNTIATAMLLLSELYHNPAPLVRTSHAVNLFFTVISILSTIGAMSTVIYFYADNIKRQHRELDLLAQTDSLTGIYNRRALFQKGNFIFSDSRKRGGAFSLLLMDIDYFKRINDTYSHAAGDMVLKELTMLIRKNIRERDFFSRYGGEEFALLLADTGGEPARKVADSLRRKVEDLRLIWEGNEISVTISMGIADYADGSWSFDELLKKADKALYRAKEKGRNRVEKEISTPYPVPPM